MLLLSFLLPLFVPLYIPFSCSITCKCKIVTKGSYNVGQSGEHNHANLKVFVKLRIAEFSSLSSAADNPFCFTTSTGEAKIAQGFLISYYKSVHLQDLTLSMAAACPGMEHHLTSTKAMQRRPKRTKAKGVNMPKEPKTINKIVKTIPDILTKTTDGGVFMRFCGYVGNSDTDDSFMFVSHSGLDLLIRYVLCVTYVTFYIYRCKYWGLYGTFAAASGVIYQVFIISVYTSYDFALADVSI